MKIRLAAFSSVLIFTIGCVAQTQPRGVQTKPAISVNEGYQSKLKSINAERLNLAAEYKKSASEKARKEILEKGRENFIASIDREIFPFWYGTIWDFYGTTEMPQTGKIACGYFVSTVLRDAGLKVNRVSLAQQASENIVKSLTTESHINRYRNFSLEKFVGEIVKSGKGLYVVGLDFHVGFIYHDGAEVYFIHSSYVEPSYVIKEKAAASPVLGASKYRVVGKISDDDALVLKWLNAAPIATVK